MDFNFDLAEPLQTSTTHHQRQFSRSALSNIKFEPRTAEQREADARRNGPKYAREKAVNSMLTARFLKAKKAFDAWWAYDIDEAWDGEAGAWREDRDPWLRVAGGEDTVGAFLRGYVKARVEATAAAAEAAAEAEAGTTGGAGADGEEGGAEAAPAPVPVAAEKPLSADELQGLALAVVRVAKVDLEAAGRDSKALDADFKKGVLEIVAQLKAEYNLPQSAPEEEEADEEVEEETNGIEGQVNGS